MDDKEITALAREYAEFTDMSPVDKKNISAICECFLKYTLRRYYLVEKEAVRKKYGRALETNQKRIETSSHVLCAIGSAQQVLLESLFPEIGKEIKKAQTNSRSHENPWCENEL